MAVISISIPEELLSQADGFIKTRGFAGRSELARAALRDFVQREAQTDRAGRRSATLTLLYPHGSERKLGELRHEFTDILTGMMHGHTGDLCVEVFVLNGDGRRIRQFTDALRAARDTRLVTITYTDV